MGEYSTNSFCLEAALDGAFVNADTLPLRERRSGTRLAARKRTVRQVPASFNGLLITNAPSRATFQSKAGDLPIFPTPMKSNPARGAGQRNFKNPIDKHRRSMYNRASMDRRLPW